MLLQVFFLFWWLFFLFFFPNLFLFGFLHIFFHPFWAAAPNMGVWGGTSGLSADVPVCRTYTPVGLKPIRKKKAQNKKIVAKALDGQRYPCPAYVGCDLS